MAQLCNHDAIWKVLYKRRFGEVRQYSIHKRVIPRRERYARKQKQLFAWRKRKGKRIMCSTVEKANNMEVGPWKFYRDFAIVTNMQTNACSVISTRGNFEYHRLDHGHHRITCVEIIPWQMLSPVAPLLTITVADSDTENIPSLQPQQTVLSTKILSSALSDESVIDLRSQKYSNRSSLGTTGLSPSNQMPSPKMSGMISSPSTESSMLHKDLFVSSDKIKSGSVSQNPSHRSENVANRSQSTTHTVDTSSDVNYAKDQGLLDRRTTGLDTYAITASLDTVDNLSYVNIWYMSREHSECRFMLEHGTGRISVLTLEQKYNTMAFRTSRLSLPQCDVGSDNTEFISVSTNGFAKRWNAHSGHILETFEFQDTPTYSLQYDREKYVVGSNAPVKWFDFETKQIIRTFQGHKDVVQCLRFDYFSIYTGSKDHTIKVWDARSSKSLLMSLGGMKHKEVTDLHIDRFKILASAGDLIYVWDIRTGRLMDTLVDNIGHTITGIQIDDEKLMLSLATSKHQLKIYHLK